MWFPLFKLFGYIAVAASGVFGLQLLAVKAGFGGGQKVKPVVGWIQSFVGSLFIFSGFIKAIDPIGTAYKMEDYFEVFAKYNIPFMDTMTKASLGFSIFMVVFEIVLGVLLLKGAWRKPVTLLLILMMVFFTFLTGWTAVTGDVSSCGCFGDFLVLKPLVSFVKDLILLPLCIFLYLYRKDIVPFATGKMAWVAFFVSTLLSGWFCFHNSYQNEPWIDFRNFAEGVNIENAKTECAQHPTKKSSVFTYVNEKDGKTVEVTSEDIMKEENKYLWDATLWKADMTKTKEVVLQEGCTSLVQFFDLTGEDSLPATDLITKNPNYNFVIMSKDLKAVPAGVFKDKINPLAAAAEKDSVKTYVISHLPWEDIEKFRFENQTAYPFLKLGDDTILKAMMRSNPGILLFKNGTIVKKWHYKQLPDYQTIKSEYMK